VSPFGDFITTEEAWRLHGQEMPRAVLPICLALFASIAGAQLPPPGVQLVRIISQPMLASVLVGLEVRHANGERAGRIEDLVLDVDRNAVRHALIDLAKGRAAVPLLDLRLSLEKRYVSLPADRPVRPAPRDPDGPTARTLIGRTVQDQSGGPAGELHDVLVDAHGGSVPFALLRRKGKLHPLPLDALRVEGERLVLRLDPSRLQASRAFSAEELDANLENSDFLQAHAAYADRLTKPGT
jgi:sporulation protein YlmC with PRC-barrel domain